MIDVEQLVAEIESGLRMLREFGTWDPKSSVDELLERIEAVRQEKHVVRFGAESWSLEHPIRCRVDLLGCAVHRGVSESVSSYGLPPLPGRGRYTVEVGTSGDLEYRWLDGREQNGGSAT